MNQPFMHNILHQIVVFFLAQETYMQAFNADLQEPVKYTTATIQDNIYGFTRSYFKHRFS